MSADIARIDPKFVECLQRLRNHVGKGVTIISGFRSWKRNRDVYAGRKNADGTPKKPTSSEHCGGRAADIKIAGMNGLEIGKAAIDACGPNIGVGLDNTYAHIDVRGSAAAWNYGGVKDSWVAEIKRYQREKGGSRKPSTAGAKPRPDAAKPPAELVRFAQRVLNAAERERLDDDGNLGRLTRDALARFRTRYGLGPDGVLDAKTELALAQSALEAIAQQSIFTQPGVLDATTEQALITFKSDRGLGFNATLDAATRAALTDALSRRASAPGGSVPVGALDRIIQVAAQSKIARYRWRDRGVSPPGYIKGMALVYARVYCKLKAGDAAATDMAKANTGNTDKDALAHYAQEFNAVGMDNESAGVDTLRHLFVLLIGLGMRESSGSYCRGRDRSASNTSADTAEAGLFQTSFNARGGEPFVTAALPAVFGKSVWLPGNLQGGRSMPRF